MARYEKLSRLMGFEPVSQITEGRVGQPVPVCRLATYNHTSHVSEK